MAQTIDIYNRVFENIRCTLKLTINIIQYLNQQIVQPIIKNHLPLKSLLHVSTSTRS